MGIYIINADREFIYAKFNINNFSVSIDYVHVCMQ